MGGERMIDGLTSAFEARLKEAYVIWFTTVREDGMPLPTPVWFIWENDSFLIYSSPTAQKVRNVQKHPQVALNLNSTPDGDEYTVFHAEAVVDPTVPLPSKHPAYFAKYEAGIGDIGMTPDSFDATFSLGLRVRPRKVRGE
jgi:PPOX class probable F420-dependent enzyme